MTIENYSAEFCEKLLSLKEEEDSLMGALRHVLRDNLKFKDFLCSKMHDVRREMEEYVAKKKELRELPSPLRIVAGLKIAKAMTKSIAASSESGCSDEIYHNILVLLDNEWQEEGEESFGKKSLIDKTIRSVIRLHHSFSEPHTPTRFLLDEVDKARKCSCIIQKLPIINSCRSGKEAYHKALFEMDQKRRSIRKRAEEETNPVLKRTDQLLLKIQDEKIHDVIRKELGLSASWDTRMIGEVDEARMCVCTILRTGSICREKRYHAELLHLYFDWRKRCDFLKEEKVLLDPTDFIKARQLHHFNEDTNRRLNQLRHIIQNYRESDRLPSSSYLAEELLKALSCDCCAIDRFIPSFSGRRREIVFLLYDYLVYDFKDKLKQFDSSPLAFDPSVWIEEALYAFDISPIGIEPMIPTASNKSEADYLRTYGWRDGIYRPFWTVSGEPGYGEKSNFLSWFQDERKGSDERGCKHYFYRLDIERRIGLTIERDRSETRRNLKAAAVHMMQVFNRLFYHHSRVLERSTSGLSGESFETTYSSRLLLTKAMILDLLKMIEICHYTERSEDLKLIADRLLSTETQFRDSFPKFASFIFDGGPFIEEEQNICASLIDVLNSDRLVSNIPSSTEQSERGGIIFGLVGLTLGAVLAPFTGGVSLTVGGALFAASTDGISIGLGSGFSGDGSIDLVIAPKEKGYSSDRLPPKPSRGFAIPLKIGALATASIHAHEEPGREIDLSTPFKASASQAKKTESATDQLLLVSPIDTILRKKALTKEEQLSVVATHVDTIMRKSAAMSAKTSNQLVSTSALEEFIDSIESVKSLSTLVSWKEQRTLNINVWAYEDDTSAAEIATKKDPIPRPRLLPFSISREEFSSHEDFRLHLHSYSGSAGLLTLPEKMRRNILQFIRSNEDHTSWNCLSLVMAAIGRPHQTTDNGEWELEPLTIAKLAPGDIVFMGTKRNFEGNPRSHVAIYLGEGLYLSKNGGSALSIRPIEHMGYTPQEDFSWFKIIPRSPLAWHQIKKIDLKEKSPINEIETSIFECALPRTSDSFAARTLKGVHILTQFKEKRPAEAVGAIAGGMIGEKVTAPLGKPTQAMSSKVLAVVGEKIGGTIDDSIELIGASMDQAAREKRPHISPL